MKKLSLLFALIIIVHATIFSQCIPYGITFDTQEEINNFQTNYPGCTEIEGYVFIHGNEIINLNGLSVVTSIGGKLEINNCDSLFSLTGLSNLDSVGGSFEIRFNDSFIDFSGLESLTYVEGAIIIQNNSTLTSLTGLDNIDAGSIRSLSIFKNSSLSNCDAKSVGDYLSNPTGAIGIYDNATGCNNPPEVAEAGGFVLSCLPYGNFYFFTQDEIDSFQSDYQDCTELNGFVKIKGNDITNLTGLSAVTVIGGYLYIQNNPLLTSLSGLENVSSIGSPGDLFWIRGNDTLIDLTGLQNVTSIGGDLWIDDNNSLTTLAGLDKLNAVHGELKIVGNDTLSSLTGLDSLKLVSGRFSLLDNHPLSSLIGLNNLDSVNGDFMISDNDFLTDLMDLESLVYTGGSLSICCSHSLSSLSGLEKLTHIVGSLEIFGDPLLSNLMGLNNITSVGGRLFVYHNIGLSNLIALDNLTSIGGDLEIEHNNVLTSLTGLDNIDAESIINLSIYDNANLSTCHVQSICDYLSTPNGTVEIYDNKTECYNQEQVEAACTVSVEEQKFSEQLSSYPNPFKTSITIGYELQQPSTVQISIYDQLGALVDVIQETQTPGKQQVVWNANGQSSGMYYFTIQIGDETIRGKMVKMGN